jgi:hypothetical protein
MEEERRRATNVLRSARDKRGRDEPSVARASLSLQVPIHVSHSNLYVYALSCIYKYIYETLSCGGGCSVAALHFRGRGRTVRLGPASLCRGVSAFGLRRWGLSVRAHSRKSAHCVCTGSRKQYVYTNDHNLAAHPSFPEREPKPSGKGKRQQCSSGRQTLPRRLTSPAGWKRLDFVAILPLDVRPCRPRPGTQPLSSPAAMFPSRGSSISFADFAAGTAQTQPEESHEPDGVSFALSFVNTGIIHASASPPNHTPISQPFARTCVMWAVRWRQLRRRDRNMHCKGLLRPREVPAPPAEEPPEAGEGGHT